MDVIPGIAKISYHFINTGRSMKKSFIIGVSVFAMLLVSCASQQKVKAKQLYDCSNKVQDALIKYNKKKFSSAQYHFRRRHHQMSGAQRHGHGHFLSGKILARHEKAR